MNIIGGFLIFAGLAILLVGTILFLAEAFKVDIIWGLACLFFGPASLIFLIAYWQPAKKPFFIQLIGVGLAFVGAVIAG